MDLEATSTGVDFSNNFSGVPNTPPVLNNNDQQQPIFSIGVNTPQRPTSAENDKPSGPSSINIQDVGGAHLTVEKKAGMTRSASSPSLSRYLSLIPGSKVIGEVDVQINVPGYTGKSSDDGSSVDPPPKIHKAGSAVSVLTPEPVTKHIRKEMQLLYHRGEVNKYGTIFRKPGLDHKAAPPKTTGPVQTPLPPFHEEGGTPDKTIGQKFKKWITTTPVQQSDREQNAIFPTSF